MGASCGDSELEESRISEALQPGVLFHLLYCWKNGWMWWVLTVERNSPVSMQNKWTLRPKSPREVTSRMLLYMYNEEATAERAMGLFGVSIRVVLLVSAGNRF